jgi:hypothetical protein
LPKGNLSARSGLRGGDELARLSRAFDAMAFAISEDIEERKRADEALRVSEGFLPRDLRCCRGRRSS